MLSWSRPSLNSAYLSRVASMQILTALGNPYTLRGAISLTMELVGGFHAPHWFCGITRRVEALSLSPMFIRLHSVLTKWMLNFIKCLISTYWCGQVVSSDFLSNDFRERISWCSTTLVCMDYTPLGPASHLILLLYCWSLAYLYFRMFVHVFKSESGP